MSVRPSDACIDGPPSPTSAACNAPKRRLQPSKTVAKLVRSATMKKTNERYSVHKFQQLDAYCTNLSRLRVALVLVGVPLPGLFASILPCFLPLRDVRDGPNLAIYAHIGGIAWGSTFGLLLTWREVTETPHAKYSLRQMAAVCTISTFLYVAVFAIVAIRVAYPFPFGSILGTYPLLVAIMVAHLTVFGSRLWKDPVYWHAFRSYAPSVMLQMSQVVVYPAMSVLFDGVSVTWQVILTLTFPLLKWALKAQLRKISHGLKDSSVEVAVCGIEITASIYQSMIMQTSPTPAAIAIIIGFDLLHGVFVIKVFADKHSNALLHRSLSARVSSVVTSFTSPSSSSSFPLRHELIPLARQLLHTSKIASDREALTVVDQSSLQLPPGSLSRSLSLSEKQQTLKMALETLHVAEEILLSEYFEVVVPFMNSIFMVIAVQLPSARFNPRLASLLLDPAQLSSAIGSIVLYSTLQAITLVVFHWILRYRYGISALSYLAFILERHALSINGKIIAWLPFILHFSLIHYGNDFSFQFEWLRKNQDAAR